MTEFYSITEEQNLDSLSFTTAVKLNAAHPVYKGHFPEVPVAPGVMLTQMIRDIAAGRLKKGLTLESADNIKFLMPINPVEMPDLRVKCEIHQEGTGCRVTASIEGNGSVCVKFKGRFSFSA